MNETNSRGQDYHDVITPRLAALAEWLHATYGGTGRWYVDTGPIMERDLAARAGLGFVGKNTLLINEQLGSGGFLAELLTTLPLPADQPRKKAGGCVRACGRARGFKFMTCGACVDGTAHTARPAFASPTKSQLRGLPPLRGRLPHGRHRRGRLQHRRAALRLVPDDRAQGRHPQAAAPHDGQPHLRLRHLPAGEVHKRKRTRLSAMRFARTDIKHRPNQTNRSAPGTAGPGRTTPPRPSSTPPSPHPSTSPPRPSPTSSRPWKTTPASWRASLAPPSGASAARGSCGT